MDAESRDRFRLWQKRLPVFDQLEERGRNMNYVFKNTILVDKMIENVSVPVVASSAVTPDI